MPTCQVTQSVCLCAGEAQAANSRSPSLTPFEHTAVTIGMPAPVCGKWLDLDQVNPQPSLQLLQTLCLASQLHKYLMAGIPAAAGISNAKNHLLLPGHHTAISVMQFKAARCLYKLSLYVTFKVSMPDCAHA